MEHYYSKKQTSEINEGRTQAVFKEKRFTFHTSSGVFSRKFVDFGSSLLINTVLDDFKCENADILDIGCGYGPMGIVIASFLKTSKVVMADVNERAVELAKANAIENSIKNIKVFQSDSFESITDTYDMVITNPPIRAGKKIVHGFFKGAFEHIKPKGSFYCVIQKKQGAESAKRKLSELFGNCKLIARKSGYQILKSIKL